MGLPCLPPCPWRVLPSWPSGPREAGPLAHRHPTTLKPPHAQKDIPHPWAPCCRMLRCCCLLRLHGLNPPSLFWPPCTQPAPRPKTWAPRPHRPAPERRRQQVPRVQVRGRERVLGCLFVYRLLGVALGAGGEQEVAWRERRTGREAGLPLPHRSLAFPRHYASTAATPTGQYQYSFPLHS